MDPAQLRDFARRPREEIAQEKLAHPARLFAAGGPGATLAAGHALYAHARSVRPDYPTQRDLADDLDHHVALKALLDRASRALGLDQGDAVAAFERALQRARARSRP